VIKIIYKSPIYIDKWRDFDLNEKVEEKDIESHYKVLAEWIEELVDKDNWTIIATTIEYIILQKRDYTPKALIKVKEQRTCLMCGKDFDTNGKDIRHCSNCLSNL